MVNVGQVVSEMINYYSGDVKRINHFLKVYGFAKSIGENEIINKTTQEILEIAAVTHDIGIKISEEKYNSSAGNYQELEGPKVAKDMLTKLKIDNQIIDRVCFLIGHHHTYTNINGLDYQILVEADFLVNIFEDNINKDSIINIKNNIFKTKTGIKFLDNLYLDN